MWLHLTNNGVSPVIDSAEFTKDRFLASCKTNNTDDEEEYLIPSIVVHSWKKEMDIYSNVASGSSSDPFSPASPFITSNLYIFVWLQQVTLK